MANSSLLGLIYNVTALLAVATIFDLTTSRWRLGKAWLHQVVSGLVLSTIAVLVMVTPWVYAQGIVFDTLSVVLAISGLFFGLIPTVIVMAVTVALRIAQGGDAVLTGVLVIICTGAIGIVWGRLRKRPLSAIEWYDLYLFGIVVHVTMLTLMLTLPAGVAVPVLAAITVPILLVYPMATTLLGLLIVNRLRRDQMVETLTQRESELRAIIEQIPVPLGMNDAAHRVTFLNPKFNETFGYTLEDIPTLDEWWPKAFPDPDYRRQVQADWEYAIAQARGRNKTFEFADCQVTCKDGTVRTVQVNRVGLERADLVIFHDLTERVRAQDVLRTSEEQFRTLVEEAPIPICIQTNRQFVYANQATLRLFGAETGDQLLGQPVLDFFHPDYRDQVAMRMSEVNEGRRSVPQVEMVINKLDGSSVAVEISGVPFVFRQQPGALVFIHDLTERNRADEQLRLQATALKSVADAIVITDREGMIEWVNPAFTDLTGYSSAEVSGLSPHDVMGSGVQDQAFFQHMWETILAGEVWRGQLVNRRKDHTLYPEEQSITPVRDSQGVITHFVAVKLDISVRKRHELELETVAAVSAALRTASSRAEMQAAVLDQVIALFKVEGAALDLLDPAGGELVTALGRGVWAGLTGGRNLHGNVIGTQVLAARPYLNNDVVGDPQFYRTEHFGACRAIAGVPMMVREKITGLIWIGSQRTLTEHDLGLLTSIADIAASALYRETLHELMQAQAQQMILIMEAVPEGIVLLDARGQVLLANPMAERMLAHLAPGRDDGRLTLLGDEPLAQLLTSPPRGLRHEVRAGARTYEVIARSIPNGPEPEQWIVLIDDVTQARQLQTQMQLQERLATVGQMAAGIAHDFNNIMAVILLYAEMAARAASLPERDRERLLTIRDQAYRATDLIRQILDFSRQSVLERQLIDLLPLVKEQVKLLQRTLPESITVRLDLDQDTYVVHADSTRMQQLVMNLAINARDAMPDGGELSIGLARVTRELSALGLAADRAATDWVRLTVADGGHGIPTDVLPRIFDPFFTTKAQGKGTGLGLAQVHGIVAQHDGTIEVATEPGRGTVFIVHLPASVIDASVAPMQVTEAAPGHGELVLVVEDNLALRVAMTEMVEAMHYNVVVAANGQDALQLLQSRGHDIAVVLSDVVMPTLGGVALLHAMRKRGWTMPVILMTGHPLETDMTALQGNEVFAWLPKPVSPSQLAIALAEALAAPARP